jgi:hypothetical protein
MTILDKIGPEKQRISERLMRVEQRRSRSDFVATKLPGTEDQVRRARNSRNVG